MKKLTSGIIALSVVVGGAAGIIGLSPAFASTSAAPMAVVTAPAPTSTATAATVTKASQDTGPNIQQQVGNQTGPDTKGAPEKDGTEKKGAEKDTGPDVQQQGNFQQ